MIPEFEEKVLERRQRTLVVQDWKGNVCEISDEFGTRHLKDAVDFVTRRWIRCPVENLSDWESMKARYNSHDPERLPPDAPELASGLVFRKYEMGFEFPGPFWQLREWLGFENLCTSFYDRPTLIEEMIEFWTEHIAVLIARGLEYVTPDWVRISEDMAYRSFSMISPAMCRRYLLPCWRRWADLVRAAGVPLYGVDSDGFIGELIPIWIDAGMNFCDPVEVAAGNDINLFRRTYGVQMAYRGGIDKRAIAAGGSVLEDEIRRVTPVIERGGFVPGCDHAVPPDVSWRNYVHYVRLLAERTGWV
jgi:uroporphyrinogen decarboxylase